MKMMWQASMLAALALWSGAGAVAIEGEIRNVAQVQAGLGGQDVRVLLASLSQGELVGLSTLRGARFSIDIPASFRPRTVPMNLCPGVTARPSEPRIYTAESLVVYQAGKNSAALLMQADHPTDPTRRTQWVYSDRAATIQGRCTGLNSRYDLKLRRGWTAVMTVSEPGTFRVTNATPGLPYWVQGPFTPQARAAFGGVFGGK
ncbi:hypothetical protein [Deinococcus hohokamensis]|uniref:DUF4412 domain-containing protein n=1 Tax=Deinococcus hohokamensis TaxID=309883 RepID=A0ABV9I9M2_9DEIO